MVTQNSIDSNIPIEVSKGGTGSTTLAGAGIVSGPASATDQAIARFDLATGKLIQDSVITIGNGGACAGCTVLDVDNVRIDGNTISTTLTNANVVLEPDGTGQVRCNTSNIYQLETVAGGIVRCRVENDDTGAASGASAYLSTIIDSAVTGQSYYRMSISGGTSYALGIAGDDNDLFKITASSGASATLSNPEVLQITGDGETTLPKQPAFLGYLPSDDNNVTGNAATYAVGTNTAYTEVTDQNGDFTTAGVFTAPITGNYRLEFAVQMTSGSMTGAGEVDGNIDTSNRDYFFNAETATGNEPNLQVSGSALADMDAADTAFVEVRVNGIGANTADIQGATLLHTFFSGNLAC